MRKKQQHLVWEFISNLDYWVEVDKDNVGHYNSYVKKYGDDDKSKKLKNEIINDAKEDFIRDVITEFRNILESFDLTDESFN